MKHLWAGVVLCFCAAAGAVTKAHVVTFGVARTVAAEDANPMKIRVLLVDGAARGWVTGDVHEVTDTVFTVQRVVRLNDALSGESGRWVWLRGGWIQVDKSSGRITALHLPDFEANVSQVVWFRDYAAYCGVSEGAKTQSLTAVVTQLGARRPVARKVLSKWDLAAAPARACEPAVWMRGPVRVRLQPVGGEGVTVEVAGTAAGVVEDEGADGEDSAQP